MKKVIAAMIGIILVLAAPSTSRAQYMDTYTHTPLNSGYTPEGINNAGKIVGYY